MYEIVRSPRKNVCHLVAAGESRTACGLVRVNDMHLRLFAVRELLPHYTLCKHCEKAGGAGRFISPGRSPNAQSTRPRNA
jgi:hypothetical protein